MYARQLDRPTRIRNPRRARMATQQRITANRRGRHLAIVRTTLTIAVCLVVLLAYVKLVSNITSLSYAVDQARSQRTELQLQNARLDDEIASLTSDDRLATVAARLGMIQPEQFLRLSLQERPEESQPLAFVP